eukprot:SAG31_NODE_11171_length_1058_cov_2.437956_2_plen_154_part_00
MPVRRVFCAAHPRVLALALTGVGTGSLILDQQQRAAKVAAATDAKSPTRAVLFLGPWGRFIERVSKLLRTKDDWLLLHVDSDGESLSKAISSSPPIAAVVGGPEAVAVCQQLRSVKLLQVPFTGVDWLDAKKLPTGCSCANVHGMDPPSAGCM